MTDNERVNGAGVSSEGEELLDAGGDGQGVLEIELAVADDAIQIEMANLQQEIDRLKELYLRKMADFDNFRKRQERDAVEFRKLANADLIRDCLPVLDNLERALGVQASTESGIRQGVELVLRQLKDILNRYGLVELGSVGMPFDPSIHEAIQRREQEGVEETTVVEALQKGYLLGERLLRPALVIVAVPMRPSSDVPETTAEEVNG